MKETFLPLHILFVMDGRWVRNIPSHENLRAKRLGSGIVTNEIRGMFKNEVDIIEGAISSNNNCGNANICANRSGSIVNDVNARYSPAEVDLQESSTLKCPNTSSRASGWRGLKSEMADLHSVFMLFREEVVSNVAV